MKTKKPTVKKVLESVVLRNTIDYLFILQRRKEVSWFSRMNNTGMWRGNRYVPVFGSSKGLPDIIVLSESRGVLFIECKSSVGTQSEDQKEFEIAARRAGASYLLCRDITQIDDFFNQGRTV